MSARLARIDAIQRDRDQVCEELSAVVVTEELLHRIESAAAAVDRTGDQLALISAAVEFTAAADIELAVGDQRVSLSAGQSWSTTATGPTEVEVPGVLTARITPGATALDVQAKHAAAQQELTAALAAADVADLSGGTMRRPAAPRTAEQPRPVERDVIRPVRRRRRRPTALAAGAVACRSTGRTRSHDGYHRRPQPNSTRQKPLAWPRTPNARPVVVSQRPPTSRLAETSTRATVLLDKVATQRAELERATDQLAQERASVSDEDLSASADAEPAGGATAAQQRAAELAEELAAAAPDAVAAELAAATRAAESLRDRYEDAARALREVSIELSVFGSEGRQGKLDAAETEREHAASEHTRVGQPGPGRGAAAVGDGTPPRHHPTALRRALPHGTAAARPPGVRAHFRGRRRQRVCVSAAERWTASRCLTNPCPAGPKSNSAFWRGWPAPLWSPRRTPFRWWSTTRWGSPIRTGWPRWGRCSTPWARTVR